MSYKSIHVLEDLVARQIAAGEVIDRPSSALRELLDNCIDAGAAHIDIQIANYGLELILVSDDGHGMKKKDIELCSIPHATSKITRIQDLSTISSLGFRGEALSSIASVSKLTVSSKHKDDSQAWKVISQGTSISAPLPTSRATGTTIQVEQLFTEIPARRKFLSSPLSEINHLRHVLLSKAAAFPDIAFHFKPDTGKSISLLQETPLSRSIKICAAHVKEQDFTWIENSLHTSSIKIALGHPHIAQKNRKHIHIYINNRQVKEFSLSQAIEYAYRFVLHGRYPQVVVFLSLPPENIDVNIHPAKSEVKIKNIDIVRQLVISSIEHALTDLSSKLPSILKKEFETSSIFEPADTPANHVKEKPLHTYHDHNNTPSKDAAPSSSSSREPHTDNAIQNTYTQLFPHAIHEMPYPSSTHPPTEYKNTSRPHQTSAHTTKEVLDSIREHKENQSHVHSARDLTSHWQYVGMLFNTYLLFEHTPPQDNVKHLAQELILLDFHATHERILYDKFLNGASTTHLLVSVPLSLELDPQSASLLIKNYKKIGVIIEPTKRNTLTLTAIPAQCPLGADEVAHIIETIPLRDRGYAKIFVKKACRNAVKAGDFIDPARATSLLNTALTIQPPRCPHGRPLWLTLQKHTIDKMIGRK